MCGIRLYTGALVCDKTGCCILEFAKWALCLRSVSRFSAHFLHAVRRFIEVTHNQTSQDVKFDWFASNARPSGVDRSAGSLLKVAPAE